jgi:hypothetical protein
MKKILFTVQVFALIAALPLYVITELNQVKATSALPETSTDVIEIQEMPVSMKVSDTTVVFESQYLAFKKQNNTVVKAIN